MFRCILIMAALFLRLIACSSHACEENANTELPAGRRSHFNILQTLFRFSRCSDMFCDANGIPYQYHIPRTGLILEGLNNGRIKVFRRGCLPSKGKGVYTSDNTVGDSTMCARDRSGWRLAASTRELTTDESINVHLWRRDPVPLNRLMVSLESPIFLGNFFYALTSLTEIGGVKTISRFYYAPVLTAKYGRRRSNFEDLAVSNMELNVFSVCIEPSDAPEDAAIPLMHRPQRIIDAGLRSNKQNKVYDVRAMLRENATNELTIAKNYFTNSNWDTFFSDTTLMVFKQLPGDSSQYTRIKTPFGHYFEDYIASGGPLLAAFHGYNLRNDAYAFAYGPGGRFGFNYSVDDSKLLIFLNPKTHIRNENKLWGMCVDLWKGEMRARYGSCTHSRLVHPHAYLDEDASTAPHYEMLPRYEAMGIPRGQRLRRGAKRPGSPSKPKKSQHRNRTKRPKKLPVEDIQSKLESPKISNGPRIVAGLGEAADPGLCDSFGTGELAVTPHHTSTELGGSSFYFESSASYGNSPNMAGTSDLPSSEPCTYASEYWTSKLPSSAGFGTIDGYLDGPLFELADRAPNWLLFSEPYNAARDPEHLSYPIFDTAVGTCNSQLPTESTHVDQLADSLLSEPDQIYGGLAPDLLTRLQEIDEKTLTGILDGL